jgi:hypothetical protein
MAKNGEFRSGSRSNARWVVLEECAFHFGASRPFGIDTDLNRSGERRRELSPQVRVETHIEDVLETLWFEDIDQVHPVLHSYAGILARPIAERTVELLSSITFLGAFLVQPGECLLDVEPPATATRYRRLALERGDGWRLPAITEFLEQWGISDPVLREAVGKRLTDFPLVLPDSAGSLRSRPIKCPAQDLCPPYSSADGKSPAVLEVCSFFRLAD